MKLTEERFPATGVTRFTVEVTKRDWRLSPRIAAGSDVATFLRYFADLWEAGDDRIQPTGDL